MITQNGIIIQTGYIASFDLLEIELNEKLTYHLKSLCHIKIL